MNKIVIIASILFLGIEVNAQTLTGRDLALKSVDSTYLKYNCEGGEMFNELVFKLLTYDTYAFLEVLQSEKSAGNDDLIRLVLNEIENPLGDIGLFSEENIKAIAYKVYLSKACCELQPQILSALDQALAKTAPAS